MDKSVAISVQGVSKTFKIPHEKISSLRGVFVSAFKKKSFEEFKALDDVSFEVKKGEFFGIIGRNGSGKSTLLKVLAGIYRPDKGKVHINGLISPFLELGIGFNPELSGRDNVYLNATVLGLKKKDIDAKFDSIVKFSELERFIDQKLNRYSSGMQVRLAFSVAIHANREILLMDEVLAVGDSNFQSKCLEEFNKYRDAGKTVIIVTHDISIVQRYCDRAMLIRNGKIVKVGKAEEVGNAYIHDNMDDEERRIVENEKQKIIQAKKELKSMLGKKLDDDGGLSMAEQVRQKEEMKNRIVEITGVDFLDKDGKVKNVFETGGYLDILIKYKVNKSVKKINFGIGMHAASGGQIFGYNTVMDNYDVENSARSVILHFNNIPILHGEYFFNVVCFGDFEQEYYDIRPNIKKIRVFSNSEKSKYRGFFDIEHNWSLK